jgi:hypothetical protein
MMLWTKIKMAAVLAAGVAVIGGGGAAATRLALANRQLPSNSATEISAVPIEAVKESVNSEQANGLKLILLANNPIECHDCMRKDMMLSTTTRCGNCTNMIYGNLCSSCALKLGCCHLCGKAIRSYLLRWENVGKDPLIIYRQERNLRGKVFLKNPDGTLAAEIKEIAVSEGVRVWHIRLDPGKINEENFDPWQWVVKPEKPGEYTLWVEFEQTGPFKMSEPIPYWTGKLRSNAVKVVIPAKTGAAPATGLATNITFAIP